MESNMTEYHTKENKRNFKMPKNIRQIGNIQGSMRIYMEDYVYTYLHGSSRSEWAHRGSVFLGNRYQENGQKFVFISGLVQIKDAHFLDGVPQFTDAMWSSVYQDMKNYYEDVEILGWGMDVSGSSAKLTGDLERMHREAFQGQEKLLFLQDTLEKEEAFYIYEKNMLRRRDGYYVYYEKNPQMQEYMLREKETHEFQAETDPQKDVVINYRARTAENSKKSGRGFRTFVYVASLSLIVAVSAMGVHSLNSAGKIQQLEAAVSFLEADRTSVESPTIPVFEPIAEEKQEQEADVAQEQNAIEKEQEWSEETVKTADNEENESLEESMNESNDTEASEENADETVSEEVISEETASEEVSPEEVNTQEVTNTPEESGSVPKIQPVLSTEGNLYYIVEAGESLLGISQKLYQKDYTKELCEINKLEDENKIYAGQKLLLLNQ